LVHFWHLSKAKRKEDELLAVWYVRAKKLPTYTYSEVMEMMRKDDLSRIPGYKPEDHDFLVDIFKKWVAVVDEWYERRLKEVKGV